MEENQEIEEHIFEEFDDKNMVRDVDEKHVIINDNLDQKFDYDRDSSDSDDLENSPKANKKIGDFKLEDLSDSDIDKIISYDEEKRKKDTFGYDFSPKVSGGDYSPNNFENKFQDFLKAPKISGTGSLKGDRLRIEADKVIDSGKTVELSDSSVKKPTAHSNSSVIINRDEKGEIENIQLTCSCGEQTLIKFDYADEGNNELTSNENETVSKQVFASEELISNSQKRAFQEDLMHNSTQEEDSQAVIREIEVEKLIKEYEDLGLEEMLGIKPEPETDESDNKNKSEDGDNNDDDDFFDEGLDFLDDNSSGGFGDIDFSDI